MLSIFYLELTSGLLRGELEALLWEDLDVESRILGVNKQIGRIHKKLLVYADIDTSVRFHEDWVISITAPMTIQLDCHRDRLTNERKLEKSFMRIRRLYPVFYVSFLCGHVTALNTRIYPQN